MLELHDDGTIDVDIGTGPTKLRRPKLGEFRTLREAAWTASAAAATSLAAAAELDEGDARRDALHDHEREAEQRWGNWAIDAVATLGNKAPPADVDDVDAFATTAVFVRTLLDHWRDIPLARGGLPPQPA